jgi:hypothetical protein
MAGISNILQSLAGIGDLDRTGKAVQDITTAITGLGAVSGSVGQGISSVGKTIGGAIGMLGGVAGPIGAVIGGVASAIGGIFDTMVGFVAKANPAAVKQLNNAWDDLQATIGKFLVPVIKFATGILKIFGTEGAAAGKAVRMSFEGLSNKVIETAFMFNQDKTKDKAASKEDIDKLGFRFEGAIKTNTDETVRAIRGLRGV